MIDIKTHNIIDMIASRDYKDVEKWLETFPNLKVVSRDGSITYNNAIATAHPNALQVSDRFHLLKNLTTYCKNYLVKILKPNVFVKATNSKTEEQVVKDKKLNLKEKQNSLFKSKPQLIHEENVAKKQEVVEAVRKMFKMGFSKRAIARELKLSPVTVENYLDPNFSAVHAYYGIKKNGMLTPYFDEINTYIEQGYTAIKIDKIIRPKGFDGSISSIHSYITNWKSSHKNTYNAEMKPKNNVEIIERNNLIKLLFKQKVKKISSEQLERVFNEYPSYASILNLVKQFRKLLAIKKVDGLEDWIESANSLKIREIDSFVNGLSRDISAVKNAIIYEYNNGLAEGSVNKLKVIKRIMYGRCSFDTLRKKVLNLELRHQFN